ncbi:MAG TPA: hypothetical protein VJ508_00320 [Saprospiraceae bacterium]|nr:hypothetical protein [Saprospiraceae bacterium]
MKKLFFFTGFICLVLSQIRAQSNCISAPPIACQFECLTVSYTGSAPPSATYTWTTTCGIFPNPNQQDPGQLCVVFTGACTIQLIVQESGQVPDTCTAEVIVFPNPDGLIEGDTTLCSGDCAPLVVQFFAGQPPFAYQVDDGTFTNFYTSSGLNDTISVCPLFTTTYTLISITDAFGCTANGPFNSSTINVNPGIMGSVTQVGNFLCANPPNQNYQWWDCGFTQLKSISQCYSIPQNGCYCVILSDGVTGCLDTVCGNYIIPCTLSCDIIAPDSVCLGDTVQLVYFGNASNSASFTWLLDPTFGSPVTVDSTDTVSFVFDGLGCVYAQLTVHDGLCETTCYDTVCTHSLLLFATMYGDLEACDSCVSIPIGLSGTPPYTVYIAHGNVVDTLSGITDDLFNYEVCPGYDTTIIYSIVNVTDSLSVCPVILGDDSVTVTTYSTPTAVITQTENELCANAGMSTYAWYDCNYSQLYSDSICLELQQSGCYCLVTTNGNCSDTACGEFIYNPCHLTCDIALVPNACIGDSIVFAYVGNATNGAVFNWLIDLPGFPMSPFTGNDTVILTYSQAGCYHVNLTVFDQGCITTCSDSICVEEPHSDASMCCDIVRCDTCASIMVILNGTPPWTIYLGDGTSIDTIAGINISPYLVTECPPSDSTVTYTLLGVRDTINNCPGYITGTNTATITLHQKPTATIVQNGDVLCAFPAGMAGYGWYTCPAGGYLDTARCFMPSVSGCYCVDVSDEYDCVDTACTTIILSSTRSVVESDFKLVPNPSSDEVIITLPENIRGDVNWKLSTLLGQEILHGEMAGSTYRLIWPVSVPPGIFVLQFITSDHRMFSFRLMHQ